MRVKFVDWCGSELYSFCGSVRKGRKRGFEARDRENILLVPLRTPTTWATNRGEEVLPYKSLMGTCGQPGYVFRDFCLKQGIDFIIFGLNQGIDFINFCLKQDKCLKQGIKNRNSFLNRVGKSAIFVPGLQSACHSTVRSAIAIINPASLSTN